MGGEYVRRGADVLQLESRLLNDRFQLIDVFDLIFAQVRLMVV